MGGCGVNSITFFAYPKSYFSGFVNNGGGLVAAPFAPCPKRDFGGEIGKSLLDIIPPLGMIVKI